MEGYELSDEEYSEVLVAYLMAVSELMESDNIKENQDARIWIAAAAQIRLKESSARITSKYCDELSTLQKRIKA